MRKSLCLFFIFILSGMAVWNCAFFRATETKVQPYSWSNFFNNDCGLMMQFKLTSADEASLNYTCSNGIVVSQMARRHQRQSDVELWTTSDLPLEQLYKLSNSKCRASLLYLGPAYATIKFPCAVVHLTVACDIVSKETIDTTTVIQLKPKKVLITYGDGTQEFGVDEDRLIPLEPFKPFKTPQPSLTMTFNKGSNLLLYLAARSRGFFRFITSEMHLRRAA